MTDYIHIRPTTMNPCSLVAGDYTQAIASWLCKGCARPFPGVKRVDVHIQDDRPEGAMNFISGAGLALAKLSLLSLLGEERLRAHLFLGRVVGPDGSRLDDWVTFRGRERVIIRGSRQVSHRVCSKCGGDVYFAMGAPYLYPAPPNEVEILESDLCGLVVPVVITAEDTWRSIRGIACDRLKVLEKPRDSLPALHY